LRTSIEASLLLIQNAHPVRGDLGLSLWKVVQRVEPISLELKGAGNVKRNLSVEVIAPELLPETVDFV
jgi:hypothetical protein